jgi:cell division septum initiation protein DivIVA
LGCKPYAGGKEAIPINNIFHLIDRLERQLGEGWRVPLSTYVLVNEDDFLDVIDQMRTAIPSQVKMGERIQQDQDRLIAQAEEEAGQVVQRAHDEAGALVEEHEIVEAAKQRSQTIIERAQGEADVLRKDAEDYARDILVGLYDQLGALHGQTATLIGTVRNGLQSLSSDEGETLDQEV